jgi:hypothetical protein
MQQSAQQSETRKIRDVSLLPDEAPVSMLTREQGMVEEVTDDDSLLVLTNKRLLGFSVENNRKETVITTTDQVHAAETAIAYRNSRPLVQGLGLIVLGIVAYFVVGLWIAQDGVFIPAVVGAVIGLFGAYQVLRYFFWEEEGSVTFQAWGDGQSEGHWKLAFPCYGESARQAQKLVDAFFDLKMEDRSEDPQSAPAWPLATTDTYSPSMALAVEPPPVPPFLRDMETLSQEDKANRRVPSDAAPDDLSDESDRPEDDGGEKLPNPGTGGDVQG